MRKLLCAAALVALAGCGYQAGGLFRDDIRTVYVAGFDNKTFRRGLEVGLTRAVVDEIKLRTPLLFAPREEADSVLSGELVAASQEASIKSERDRILLENMSVRVRFRWRDRLTGEDIVPEQTVSESTRLPTQLTEAGVGIGGPAIAADLVRQEAAFEPVLREVAQRIVEKMQRGW